MITLLIGIAIGAVFSKFWISVWQYLVTRFGSKQ
jgi:hypothetical protein